MSRDDYEEMKIRKAKGFIILGLLLLIVLIALFSSVYIIRAGERGIVLTFGKPSIIASSEGLHFKTPLAQKIIKMDIKTQKYETDASAASSDLQTVTAKIAVNYHLAAESTPNLYQTIGLAYNERVIQPAVQEVVKATTATYTAEQLITKRQEVKESMVTRLRERLVERGIIIEDINIVNFDFSPSFNAAIEAKVTAEQNALAAKNKLEQIKYEAEQRITQANAEATAIRIQAEAIQSQGGRDYVQLQAIAKWDGKMPTVTAGGAVPFINIPTSSAPTGIGQ